MPFLTVRIFREHKGGSCPLKLELKKTLGGGHGAEYSLDTSRYWEHTPGWSSQRDRKKSSRLEFYNP